MKAMDRSIYDVILCLINSPRIVNAYVKVRSTWVKSAMIARITRTLGVRPSWLIREESMAMSIARVSEGEQAVGEYGEMSGWTRGMM